MKGAFKVKWVFHNKRNICSERTFTLKRVFHAQRAHSQLKGSFIAKMGICGESVLQLVFYNERICRFRCSVLFSYLTKIIKNIFDVLRCGDLVTLIQGGQWFCATCSKLNTSSLSSLRLMSEKPLASGSTSMDVMWLVSHVKRYCP